MKLIGEILLEKELVTPQKLTLALQEQKRTGELLGNVLVRLGSLTRKDLSQVIAYASELPFVDLKEIKVDPQAVKLIPQEIAEKFKLVPFGFNHEDAIKVAMDNPNDVVAIDTLRRISRRDIEVYVSDFEAIMESIGIYYGVETSLEDEIDKNVAAALAGEIAEGETSPPIVRLVQLFLIKSIKDIATDIHISPQEMATRISYRVDGILRTGSILPKELHGPLITRVKVMSGLNIAEQRLPQDGNISFEFSGRRVDIRTSTSPTEHGENIVLRVLDKSNILLGLGHLGLNDRDQMTVRKLTMKPHGIVLSAGPTGSGKTTSLYSMLQEINALEKNVLTIEDPIEYHLPLIKQTQVNEQAGLTFATAIRHFLRQDPDIILVGEIRDLETARIAFQAALTGHLVLSTIHTNDAASSVARFLDLGVEAYLIPSCLRAIIAQRLIRKICPECSETYTPTDEELELYDLDPSQIKSLKRGRGCEKCNDTGYKGRIGIFEILEITPAISRLIARKASSDEILVEAKKAGMKIMWEDGINKVLAGVTTLEEVARVTG